MKPVKSTAEILAFKALNRDIEKTWIDWAVDMLMAGFDTENLAILAGEFEPYNQFQLQDLTSKILDELRLDYSDKNQTIKKYACYLIDKSLEGELDNAKVLDKLKDICIELDYEKYLYDFYLLYFAKDDLSYSENQWYWDGATRENIDEIITDYFKNWKTNCMTCEETTTAQHGF
ncbi:hypothetical protein [Arsenicibacter rosenii]|uniref:DUF2247 domain-containing protein n=1 Tax=Arsenicibacter rosenii TaxID=1750698 RepID=A0A1S2VE85_9BACT|nr:hypothetical protein [Arsenicibacter rosenii]OIN57034.1 hypothetical protein BLX24_22070 [Arsenicibacter rosenii]